MFSPLSEFIRQGQLSISGIGQTASSQPGLLQQPVLSETVLTAPCDNQVIEQPNIEQRGRLGNFLRENLILLAGQGSTGRMVVNQDNLRGQQFEGPFDDQPVIHHRRLHPALAYPLPLDDPVARIEVQAPALSCFISVSRGLNIRTTSLLEPIGSGPNSLAASTRRPNSTAA